MKFGTRLWTACKAASRIVLLSLMIGPNAAIPAAGTTAAELIRFLSYQSGRPGRQNVEAGLTSCGQYDADRDAAVSLARLGADAVPEIERALDSIEQLGQTSEFALGSRWLIEVYAQLKGRSAHTRISRLSTALNLNIDSATALSLGLTSFVSSSRELGTIIHCDRPGDPRDALDTFVVAWERGDHSWVEKSLGPSSRLLIILATGRQNLERVSVRSLARCDWRPCGGWIPV